MNQLSSEVADVIILSLLSIASSADIFTPPVTTTNGYPTHAQGDVTPPRHVRLPGSPLSNVGFTRFKPSPEVAKLGPSLRTAVVPVNSPQSSQRPVPSAGPQKPVSTSLKPSPSKQIVPVSSNKSRSSKKGILSLVVSCSSR